MKPLHYLAVAQSFCDGAAAIVTRLGVFIL